MPSVVATSTSTVALAPPLSFSATLLYRRVPRPLLLAGLATRARLTSCQRCARCPQFRARFSRLPRRVCCRPLVAMVDTSVLWVGIYLQYEPAPGIGRFVCGTPNVLSDVALDVALDAFEGVTMAAVRAKSIALGEFFIRLVESRCAAFCNDHGGLALASPRDSAVRGSQVSFSHEHGYPIMQVCVVSRAHHICVAQPRAVLKCRVASAPGVDRAGRGWRFSGAQHPTLRLHTHVHALCGRAKGGGGAGAGARGKDVGRGALSQAAEGDVIGPSLPTQLPSGVRRISLGSYILVVRISQELACLSEGFKCRNSTKCYLGIFYA